MHASSFCKLDKLCFELRLHMVQEVISFKLDASIEYVKTAFNDDVTNDSDDLKRQVTIDGAVITIVLIAFIVYGIEIYVNLSWNVLLLIDSFRFNEA